MWAHTIAIGIACVLLFAHHAFAGSWTLPEGEKQLILTTRFYATVNYFDGQGNLQAKRGRYRKREVQQYGEYGLSDVWTLGANVAYSSAKDVTRADAFALGDDPAASDRSISISGLNRAELFARYQLYRDDVYAFAVQPLVALPPWYVRNQPDGIPADPMEAELAVLGGRNFSLFGQSHYADFATAYRVRGQSLNDQLRFHAAIGLNLNERWTLLPEFDHTQNLGGITFATTTITGQNDYDLSKAQLSVLYHLSSRFSLQGGAFSHVDGRNTGAGGGGLLSVWIRL
jgi:protein XagA